jgi:MoaA/NifB/PqqE/SkfB family radical SAM enzyme
MHCSEAQLLHIIGRFGVHLNLHSLDELSTPVLHELAGRATNGTESIEAMLAYFLNFSNENEQPNKRTLFRNPIVSVTNRCFLKCQYCYVNSPSFTPAQFRTLSYANVTAFVDKVLEVGGEDVFSVQYFGGEPTMHDRLPEMIAYTRNRNLQARISTNGVATRIRSSEYREAVGDPGVEWRISLDAVDPEINDQSRGKGTFEAILRNLDYLRSVGANVSLKPVLTKSNISNLESYLEFAHSNGFKVTYGTLLPVGNAIKNGIKRELNEFHVASYLVEVFSRKPHLIETIELSPLGWTLKTLFLRRARALPRFTLYLHDDGNVYPMDGLIDAEFCIGTADHFDIKKLENLQEEFGLSSPRCKKCFVSGFCYTGDFHELRARDRSMKSDFYACPDRRNIYMLLMTEADRFRTVANIMLSSQYTF